MRSVGSPGSSSGAEQELADTDAIGEPGSPRDRGVLASDHVAVAQPSTPESPPSAMRESTTPAIVAAAVGDGESSAAGTLHRTFLITDIEGSTRLWEERSEAMGSALAVHDHLLRTVVTDHRGTIVKTTGDGLLAVFSHATAAIEAAVAAQRAIGSTAWGDVGQIRVRMAIHAGLAETRDGDWFGPPVNRAARILGTASGGQIVASAAAATI